MCFGQSNEKYSFAACVEHSQKNRSTSIARGCESTEHVTFIYSLQLIVNQCISVFPIAGNGMKTWFNKR